MLTFRFLGSHLHVRTNTNAHTHSESFQVEEVSLNSPEGFRYDRQLSCASAMKRGKTCKICKNRKSSCPNGNLEVSVSIFSDCLHFASKRFLPSRRWFPLSSFSMKSRRGLLPIPTLFPKWCVQLQESLEDSCSNLVCCVFLGRRLPLQDRWQELDCRFEERQRLCQGCCS